MSWKARLSLAFERVGATYLQAWAALMLGSVGDRYDLSLVQGAAIAAIPAAANVMIAFVPVIDGPYWVKLFANAARTAAVAFLGYIAALDLAVGQPLDWSMLDAAWVAAVSAALAVLKGAGARFVGDADTPNLTDAEPARVRAEAH